MSATSESTWRCSCGSRETKVLDSRPMAYGQYRRRECLGCSRRFSTMERFEENSAVVTVDDLHEFERALRSSTKLRSALSRITNRLKGFRMRARAVEATRTKEAKASEGRTDREVREGSGARQ